MPRNPVRCICLIALAAWLGSTMLARCAHADDEFRAGWSAVDITPEPGTPMAGYYHYRAADGVLDPLHAKALVVSRGDTAAAFISLDLITTTLSLTEAARAAVAERTGLTAERILISASHAHTGPVLASSSRLGRDLGGGHDLALRYAEQLPVKIANAVEAAWKSRQPVSLASGMGRESSVAFNRRFFMTDGTVGWNPGKLNPRIIREAGPIDPDLPVLAFRDPKSLKPLATFTNHAIHLDIVSGSKISADMPAALARVLADAHEAPFFSFYTTGCCGDVNHIHVRSARVQRGLPEANRIGSILAAEALQTLERAQPTTPGIVRAVRRIVPLPLAPLTDGDEAWANAVIARQNSGESKPTFLELVKAYRVIDVVDRKGEPISAEVQVIAIGDQIAFVALPGEIFVELGLSIKRASPYPMTIISELANGSVGYVPNRIAYSQGNYEVVSARCAAGSGELLVDAAIEMLRDLHRQAGSTP